MKAAPSVARFAPTVRGQTVMSPKFEAISILLCCQSGACWEEMTGVIRCLIFDEQKLHLFNAESQSGFNV